VSSTGEVYRPGIGHVGDNAADRVVPPDRMGRRPPVDAAPSAGRLVAQAADLPEPSTPLALPGHVRSPRTVPREFGSGPQVERVWLMAASLRPPCPLVCVSSADGGVGRSTLVAALGGLLALACPEPVVAVDMTGRAWGGLVHRVGRRHESSVWDAAGTIDQVASRATIERVAQVGPTGLHALVGEMEMTSLRRPPSADEAARLARRLRTLYPLALLDLPAADVQATWVALRAVVPVLVARATTDSLQHTLRLLAQLRAVGLTAVADRSVLVVMATSPHASWEMRAVQRQAATAGNVVPVPYDPGLADPAPIDVRRLRRVTRTALLDVAAAVLTRCPARSAPRPRWRCGPARWLAAW